MKSIFDLSELRFSDREIAGGKGAALGELIRMGAKVPTGFVISTDVWKRYRMTGSLDLEEMEAINDAAARLSAGLLAVRSSTSVEDGESATWAGQFRTFLDVEKRDVVFRVGKCLGIPGSSAAEYGKKHAIDISTIPMAVIVQEMVHPTFAGVAFSADPVSKNTQEIVIEAVEGLATGVVDGSANPDFYRVDKTSSSVMEHHSASGRAIIPAHQLQALIELVKKIESAFGRPQDIEWACVGDTIYVVQSRSITTL